MSFILRNGDFDTQKNHENLKDRLRRPIANLNTEKAEVIQIYGNDIYRRDHNNYTVHSLLLLLKNRINTCTDSDMMLDFVKSFDKAKDVSYYGHTPTKKPYPGTDGDIPDLLRSIASSLYLNPENSSGDHYGTGNKVPFTIVQRKEVWEKEGRLEYEEIAFPEFSGKNVEECLFHTLNHLQSLLSANLLMDIKPETHDMIKNEQQFVALFQDHVKRRLEYTGSPEIEFAV